MQKVLLIVALLLLVGQIRGQDDLNPDLLDDIQQIERSTSEIRELERKEEITLRFPTKDELLAYLVQTIDEQFTPEELAEEMLFYRAFDLLPADLDLRQLVLDLYVQQIGGFYDSDTRVMNVILTSGELPDGALPLMEKIVYSHEYVHALQDQYFDLGQIMDEFEESDDLDRLLAIQALIEGDASLAMAVYSAEAMAESPVLGMLQILVQGLQTGNLALPAGTPDVIAAELLFPYDTGLVFTQALYAENGWDEINDAFANLPTSTEQVIHPEKYLAGEMPVAVELLDQSELLGDGWELVHDRTLGEFYLRQYLGTQLTSDEVNVAAEGWGGDRYHIYYDAQSDTLGWLLKLVWDTPSDQTEFVDIFSEFLNSRFGTSQADACWENASEAMCLATNEGVLISFAPTIEQAQELLGD